MFINKVSMSQVKGMLLLNKLSNLPQELLWLIRNYLLIFTRAQEIFVIIRIRVEICSL
jgi:hypothetical protein